MADIKSETWGTTAAGASVQRFSLTNDNGCILRVIELGATVTELHIRDRSGNLADIVLGFDSLADYEENTPYFGCTTGRVANRIAGASFEIDGTRYQLARNHGQHHLHGGDVGLNRRVWKGAPSEHEEGPAVRMTYLSPDGEEGYPGNLAIAVTFALTQRDTFRIDYEATTNKATPVNLTNHSYFNLSGAGSGTVHDHVLSILAGQVTERGEEGIPTGSIVPVSGTPLDFGKPKRIGEDIDQIEGGYDHNFVLNHGGGFYPEPSAKVYDPRSGRTMELFTTEPGVQLYTSYSLEPIRGKDRAQYERFHAVCLETQHFPDAVNRPQFPSVILRPGDTYRQTTEYRFSVR